MISGGEKSRFAVKPPVKPELRKHPIITHFTLVTLPNSWSHVKTTITEFYLDLQTAKRGSSSLDIRAERYIHTYGGPTFQQFSYAPIAFKNYKTVNFLKRNHKYKLRLTTQFWLSRKKLNIQNISFSVLSFSKIGRWDHKETPLIFPAKCAHQEPSAILIFMDRTGHQSKW